MNSLQSITYILWNTKLNGGNKITLTHVHELEKKGFVTTVIPIIGGDISWFPHKINTQNIIQYLFWNNKNTLVATFWPTAYVAAILPAKRKFYFIQNWEIDFYNNKLLRFLVKRSFTLPLRKITFGSYLKKRLLSFYPHQIIFVTDNAVDDIFFQTRKKTKKNAITIVSVITSYTKYKGIDLLEEIVRRLKMKNTKFKFTLITTKQKAFSNVFDNFISNPSRGQLAQLYRQADILLNTSRVEGFPLPPLEAMASGCLVVATDSGGINEYAKNNYNAIVIKTLEDIWNKNIIEKLLQNKQLVKKLRRNAIVTAKTYKWQKIIDELAEIYKND